MGVEQHKCTNCGDCVTGCNYAAKNTLIMNYLPDAANHGAEIFTEVSVRWIERKDNQWLVQCELLGVGREKFKAPTVAVAAGLVVLGAGTLGSTEILLRSARHGLALSNRLGESFTGNGDVLAFGYDTGQVINGVGWGHHKPGQIPPVGPCITGIIDMRHQPALTDGMVAEEGSPPGALGVFLPGAFEAAAAVAGTAEPVAGTELIEEKERELLTDFEGPYRGAVNRTQTYLVMTHDNGSGPHEPGRQRQPRAELAGRRQPTHFRESECAPEAGHGGAGRHLRPQSTLEQAAPQQSDYRPSIGGMRDGGRCRRRSGEP